MESGQNHIQSSLSNNDRLKKAIERNRRKRLQEEANSSLKSGAGAVSAGPSRFSKPQAQMSTQSIGNERTPVRTPPPRVNGNVKPRVSAPISRPPVRPNVSTIQKNMPPAQDRVLPKMEEGTETPKISIKERINRSAQDLKPRYNIGKSTKKVQAANVSQRKRVKQKEAKAELYFGYLVKAVWVFCLILCLRLVFADRGVAEYYKRSSMLEERQKNYSQISSDNQDLLAEIMLLKSNKKYQKSIIRDHLGFISKNEYLVLID